MPKRKAKAQREAEAMRIADDIQRIQNAGEIAFLNGFSEECNPYEPDTEEFKIWLDGYLYFEDAEAAMRGETP